MEQKIGASSKTCAQRFRWRECKIGFRLFGWENIAREKGCGHSESGLNDGKWKGLEEPRPAGNFFSWQSTETFRHSRSVRPGYSGSSGGFSARSARVME